MSEAMEIVESEIAIKRMRVEMASAEGMPESANIIRTRADALQMVLDAARGAK